MKYVDSPFDADGDGFFDSSVPDCKETYARRPDRDDRDASTHPGMEEIGCNGVDDRDPGTADEVDLDGDGFRPARTATTATS